MCCQIQKTAIEKYFNKETVEENKGPVPDRCSKVRSPFDLLKLPCTSSSSDIFSLHFHLIQYLRIQFDLPVLTIPEKTIYLM